ncbi:MAG: phosphogluconate dehydrogenase (NAD(+)-dependent, decarboxylating) [Acidimicrobiales bacterium]
MKIAMVGLGKMGANMTKRLLRNGHQVVVYDRSEQARLSLAGDGAAPAESLQDAVGQLEAPRVVWLMLPAGDPTDQTIAEVKTMLARGDIIVDGGNSNYLGAAPAARELATLGIAFIDAGVSGGIWGLDNGYCLMVGGDKEAVSVVEPVFYDLAPEGGYAHVGPPGAGHFVKMVHNGIEYGLMQSYAEGFELLAAAEEFHLDLHEIASIWRYGSVVRSWLLDLAHRALAPGAGFEHIEGVIVDSGEGRWTVEESVKRGVAAPVMATSLFARFSSRSKDSVAPRLVAALRNQFGGHAVVTDTEASGPGGPANSTT